MHKLIYVLSLFTVLPFFAMAQNDTIRYDVSVSGLASSGTYAPFWMQSRDYGTVSSAPNSAMLMAGIYKEYRSGTHLFDYGFKANAFVRTDRTGSTVWFQELYAKARFLVFDFVIGSREKQYGNQDSTLSAGGFLFSQNARPMPEITVGIEHFTPVPFTSGFLEVKGALSQGWFTDNTYGTGVLLHHKYLYAKLGGKLPVHLQYGLDHVAQWGGNMPGEGQQPAGFKDFISIFLGRQGGSGAILGDQINALGNHIISQSVRLDMDVSSFSIGAYWQNISEDGPVRIIGNTMNTPDGLWGISIRNKQFPFIKGIVYEYLNTTDQSGPYHDKDGIIYGGADDYFFNYEYKSGWSYYSRTIGTPFISSPIYNKSGEVYTLNSRVQVHHIGIEGDIRDYQYRFLTSFSKNYGAYYAPFPEMKQNTSMLLEVNKQFPKLFNLDLGCSVAADFGKLYGNSVGFQFSIRKIGELFHY